MKSFYKAMAIFAICMLVLGALFVGVSFAGGVESSAKDGVIRVGNHIMIPVGWTTGWHWTWDNDRDYWDDDSDNWGDSDSYNGQKVIVAPEAASTSQVQSGEDNNVNSVTKIRLNLGAGSYKVVRGDAFKVEVTGMSEDRVRAELTENFWDVEVPNGDLHMHEWNNVRGTVTIPENCNPEKVEISIGAGELTVNGISASKSAILNVGAGSMKLNDCTMNNVSIDCGMGRLEYNGTLTGDGSIECGMGSVAVRAAGDPAEFGADVNCGLGTVRFGDNRWSGITEGVYHKDAANFFKLDCGIGSIEFLLEGE
jgi:hypothetical protein